MVHRELLTDGDVVVSSGRPPPPRSHSLCKSMSATLSATIGQSLDWTKEKAWSTSPAAPRLRVVEAEVGTVAHGNVGLRSHADLNFGSTISTKYAAGCPLRRLLSSSYARLSWRTTDAKKAAVSALTTSQSNGLTMRCYRRRSDGDGRVTRSVHHSRGNVLRGRLSI